MNNYICKIANIDEMNNIISSVLNNKRLEGKEYTNGNLNREI